MMDPAADLAAQLMHLPNRDTYLDAASQLLLKLFPGENVAWNVLDAQAGTAEVRVHPRHPFPDISGILLDVWKDHPLVLSYVRDTAQGIWRPRRLSDLVSDRELYRTRAFQVGLGPLGSNRQLSFLAARPAPFSIRGWAMNRWERDFSDHDVELARYLQPMLQLLESAYAGAERGTASQGAGETSSLTPREQEVLQFVAQGFTAVAISHLLGISPRTVEKHLEHAYAKLGCTNRVDAIRRLGGNNDPGSRRAISDDGCPAGGWGRPR